MGLRPIIIQGIVIPFTFPTFIKVTFFRIVRPKLSCPLKGNSSTLILAAALSKLLMNDRHRQVMSVHAPLKERIGDESAKGAANDESAKDAGNNKSNEGSSNNDAAHNAAPAVKEPIPNEETKDSSQENNNSSIADKNARALTDLMWQEHPSSQAGFALSSAEQERLDAYTLLWKEHQFKQVQKSATTAFFQENAKGSSPKWGDLEDEETPSAPLWNYNATTEENASSSAAASAEKSKKGSPAGKDEIDSN
jgi:hypothetical protein